MAVRRTNPTIQFLVCFGLRGDSAGAANQAKAVRAQLSFLQYFFLSLAPGFSRAKSTCRKESGFNRFLNSLSPTKPLKRLCCLASANTGLKPGANERLLETEMRPFPREQPIQRNFTFAR